LPTIVDPPPLMESPTVTHHAGPATRSQSCALRNKFCLWSPLPSPYFSFFFPLSNPTGPRELFSSACLTAGLDCCVSFFPVLPKQFTAAARTSSPPSDFPFHLSSRLRDLRLTRTSSLPLLFSPSLTSQVPLFNFSLF